MAMGDMDRQWQRHVDVTEPDPARAVRFHEPQ